MNIEVFKEECEILRRKFSVSKLPDSILNEVWDLIKDKDNEHIRSIKYDLLMRGNTYIFSKYDFTGEFLTKSKSMENVLKDLKAKSLYDAVSQKRRVKHNE